MKKRTVLTSVLVIALCLSLIAGSTFALFTSGSEVNVAITSGKVRVLATIDRASITLISLNQQTLDETTWTLNGDTLALTNMVPGDKIAFTINVENQSNVTVNYRTLIGLTGDAELLSGMIITVDGTTYAGGSVSDWQTLVPGTDIAQVQVSIELPATAGNEYQEKTLNFKFAVEAVQGNAGVQNPTRVSSSDELQSAAAAGEDVSLTADIVLTRGLTLKDGVTVYGNGHTISGYPVHAGKNTTIKDVVFANPTNVSENHPENDASNLYCGGSIILDGCIFKDSKWDCVQLTPTDGDEIVINNCTFVDSTQRFIHIEAKPVSQEHDVKITITNNRFGDASRLGNDSIGLYYVKLDSIDFGGNNVFTNHYGSIYICGESTATTITGEEAFRRFGSLVLTSVSTGTFSGNITLNDDISGAANNTSNALNNYKAGIVVKKGVLDGNGNTVQVTRIDVGCEVTEGIIKNLTVSNAFRGIMTYNTTGTIYIDHVTVTDCGYGINTGAGTNNSGMLVVTNSTLGGWSSWAGLTSASFTDCTFVKGSYWDNDTLNQYLRPYVTSTFENCDFVNGMHFDLSKLVEGATVTFKNCTCNGEALTADNVYNYLHLYLDNRDTQPNSAADLVGKLIFG